MYDCDRIFLIISQIFRTAETDYFPLTNGCYRADSIYPAMLMHFLNNAFSVLISCCPEKMESVFPVLYQETLQVSDILLLLVIGLIFAGIGWAIL